MKIIYIIFLAFILSPNLMAQTADNKVALSARYDGGDVVLTYKPELTKDSIEISVFRKSKIGEILIRNKKIAGQKTWVYVDTFTRKNPGLYQYKIQYKLGDQLQSDVVWAYAYAADVIPVAGNIKSLSIKGENTVLITWNIVNNFMVKTITVQRSREKNKGYKTIAVIEGDVESYVDQVDDANEPFFYRLDMLVYNTNKIYQSAAVFVMPQFNIIPSMVSNLTVSQNAKNILLKWESDDTNSRAFFVQKRINNTGDFTNASVAITKNATGKYQWVDTTSILKNNDMYQYIVLSESNSYDKSLPSDTVVVSFKQQNATLNPPNDLKILSANDTLYHLAWTPNDLYTNNSCMFTIYFKAKNDIDFKPLQNGRLPHHITSFEIAKPKDGDSYKIKSVDGLQESVYSLPVIYSNVHELNFGPKYLKSAKFDEGIVIKWNLNPDREIKTFKLYKHNGKEFVAIETIEGNTDYVLTKNYTAGQLNIYKLFAVDKNGIQNKGSEILQIN